LQKTFNEYWSKKDDDHRKYMEAKFNPQVASVATSTSTLAPMPANVFIKL
jgi:hypothetical protein